LSEDVTAGGEGCHNIHSAMNKEKKPAEHTHVAHIISFISFHLSLLDLNTYVLQFAAAGSSETLLSVYHTSQMAVTFIGLTLI